MKHYLIVATPRSGTTFISRAMDHAHRTRSVVGDLILPVTCSLHALSLSRGETDFAEAIEHGFESELRRRSAINSRFDALHRLMTKRNSAKFLISNMRRQQSFERFVFKEPFLSLSPKLAMCSGAEGIFWIIRDGRDVANSLVTTYNVLTDNDLKLCRSNENPVKTIRKVGNLHIPWWVKDADVDVFVRSAPYVRAGMLWAFTAESCRAAFRKEKVVSQQRYEDLMADPVYCRTEIQNFLHVPQTAHLTKACASASSKFIGRFKRRDPSEVAELENVIGDTLSQFGYTS